MKLTPKELDRLNEWADKVFRVAERNDHVENLLTYIETLPESEIKLNFDRLWSDMCAAKTKIKTFAELWDRLATYTGFFIFNENNGEKYDSIIFELAEDGNIEKFIFQNVDDNSDSLNILPSAELKDLHFFGQNLVFTVQDEYYKQEMELWLQVRVAPQIEI